MATTTLSSSGTACAAGSPSEVSAADLVERLRLLFDRTAAPDCKPDFSLLGRLLDLVPLPISVKDAEELRYVYVNPAAAALCRIAAADALGRTTHDIYPPGDADLLAAGDRLAIADPSRSHAQTTPVTTLSGRRLFRISKTAVAGADGRSRYIICIAEDLSAGEHVARELEAKSQLLEATIANMDQGLLVLDRDLNVTLWNRRYEQLAGTPPGFLRAHMPMAELVKFLVDRGEFGEGDRDRLIGERLAAIRKPDASLDIRMAATGRTLRVDRHALPDGATVTTYTDVTAARRQEEALRASEARFAAFAAMSADWIWEQDADLRFTFVSRPLDRPFDPVTPQSLGKRREELDIVVEDPGAWAQHLDDLANRRPFRHFPLGRRMDNGEVRYSLISGDPIFGNDGEFLGYRGTGSDITAQRAALERAKAAEASAQSARSRLMTALETITQGFALFDADDRLITCNRHFLDRDFVDPLGGTDGWSFEQIVDAGLAAGWRGIIPGTDALASPEAWKAWRLAVHRDPPLHPIVYLGSDGAWKMISEKRTADGGMVSIRVDVTDLKRTEEDLRVARDAAEAAGRAKNEFLASMSHELRTPLNAIIGFAEIMKAEMFGALGSDRYRDYAKDILTSATYLMDLIRDVLDMARIEAGRKELKVVAIELKPELDGCLEMMRDAALKAGLDLTADLPPFLPAVRAEARALRQIVLNLLSNALKFTPSGGKVTVSARAVGSEMRIAVVDTGIGIPAAVLPRLARPFEQVENVLNRKRSGSGLGLALSRSLAELMNGSLVIESDEGSGTTVTLSLPLAETA